MGQFGSMHHGRTVLAQILDGLDAKEVARCAAMYPMPRDTPALSAYDHFAVLVFAQLTYRESLRDIEACLGSRRRLLYHSGIRGTVKRCNLAYANEHRDARVFGAIAAVLMCELHDSMPIIRPIWVWMATCSRSMPV